MRTGLPQMTQCTVIVCFAMFQPRSPKAGAPFPEYSTVIVRCSPGYSET